MARDSSRFGLKRPQREAPKPPPKAAAPKPPAPPPPPPPNPLVDLSSRCLEWASRSQPDGTLDTLIADAKKAEAVSRLLDTLPDGSGVTAERMTRVRRRLERAEAK